MELLEIAREDLTLRPYQTKSKEDIYKAWESVPSVMFQMPTGTGKTRLFASIIKDIQTLSVRKKERMGVLVLVHRSVEKPCVRDPRSPVPLTLAVQNSLTL